MNASLEFSYHYCDMFDQMMGVICLSRCQKLTDEMM